MPDNITTASHSLEGNPAAVNQELEKAESLLNQHNNPPVKDWRAKALRIVVQSDNNISEASTFTKCQEHSLCVNSDLGKPV